MPEPRSIDLYWSPGSCSRVPFVALEEAGAEFELRVLNPYVGDKDAGDYRTLNPKGKVPTVVIDDWVLTENPVIATVLDRTFPEARLLPQGDERLRVDVLSTMAWFASSLHPAVGRQRFPGKFCDVEEALESVRAHARGALEGAFAILEGRLEGREWLYGEWSMVDAYMGWMWFRAVGSGMDPTPFPRCADHGRRNEARPSVAKALDREEAEFSRFEEDGTVPADMPPYQVGRTPEPAPALSQ